jgi:NADH-quinone oxidoreductase subunit N
MNIHFNYTLFSEIYIFILFFIILIFNIFFHLSYTNNFPNYYKATSYLIIIILLNTSTVDLFNRLNIIQSYDLFKTSGDIIIKLFLLLISIIFFVYTYTYMELMKSKIFEYLIIIYFVIINFIFLIINIDIISFYLLLEIISLSYYILTSFNKYNQYSVESGLKYFILSSFTSICLLFGYSFIYGLIGTLNIIDLNLFFSIKEKNNIIIFIYGVSSILILIAFLFKLYAAPFHFWVSDIYQGAPSITTAFFATLTSLPLFYIFNKYIFSFFYFLNSYLFIIIVLISILSMILGALGALYQKKIKRLIAYSSVTTIGYLFIGFIQENVLLLSHSFTYFFLYILNSTGIFIIFLNLYNSYSLFFIERFSLLSGLMIKNKLLCLCLIVFFFTAAGIPPFSLFIAKLLILTGISYQLYNILLFILIITAVLSAFYYLRIIKIMSFDINKKWIYFMPIYYVNYIFCILLVILNLSYFGNVNILNIFTDYIILHFYT